MFAKNSARVSVILCSTVVCLAWTAAGAAAQEVFNGRVIVTQPQTQESSGLRALGYSSTIQEGVLRGEADYMRGYGESLQRQGAAAVLFEEAKERELKNDYESVRLFFELRELNRTNCRNERGARASMHQSTPKAAVPPEELGVSGTIAWPLVLQNKSSRDARKQLEHIFIGRAAGQSTRVGTMAQRTATDAIEDIRADLKSRIKDVSGDEYIRAGRLLTGLEKELGRDPHSTLYAQN